MVIPTRVKANFMTENQIRRLYTFTQILVSELTHDRLSLNQNLILNDEDYIIEKYNLLICSRRSRGFDTKLIDIQIDRKYLDIINRWNKSPSDIGQRIFAYSLDIFYNLNNFKDPNNFFIFIQIFEKYFFSVEEIEKSAIRFGVHQLLMKEINKTILNSTIIKRELKLNSILNGSIR